MPLPLSDIDPIKLRAQDLEGSLASFIEAAKVDPSNSEATNSAGFVCFRLKRYQESVDWLNLGDSYVELGQKEKTRNAYQSYLKPVPKGEGAEAAQTKLAALDQ